MGKQDSFLVYMGSNEAKEEYKRLARQVENLSMTQLTRRLIEAWVRGAKNGA